MVAPVGRLGAAKASCTPPETVVPESSVGAASGVTVSGWDQPPSQPPVPLWFDEAPTMARNRKEHELPQGHPDSFEGVATNAELLVPYPWAQKPPEPNQVEPPSVDTSYWKPV